MKAGWASADPVQEFLKPWMGAQGLDRAETARQFGFGQRGVDFLVANLVQQHGGSALASFEFWDQMMQTATAFGDRAVAKRADLIAVRHDME